MTVQGTCNADAKQALSTCACCHILQGHLEPQRMLAVMYHLYCPPCSAEAIYTPCHCHHQTSGRVVPAMSQQCFAESLSACMHARMKAHTQIPPSTSHMAEVTTARLLHLHTSPSGSCCLSHCLILDHAFALLLLLAAGLWPTFVIVDLLDTCTTPDNAVLLAVAGGMQIVVFV